MTQSNKSLEYVSRCSQVSLWMAIMQQLTKEEVTQISGGMLDTEVLFLASVGVLGGIMGVYCTPMIAPNVATQVIMVVPLSFSVGALTAMIAAGVVLAVLY